MQTVNLAAVGLGGWGKNVVRSFSTARHCSLFTICDSDASSLERHRSLYPQARATDSYETVLQDTNVDAVSIATPAPLHYEMARAALIAGKHVYVEKPLTLTTTDAEDLVRTADRLQRKLMVGHLLEYHPAIEMIKRQVESGDLGDVYYMYCQRLNLGVVRSQENAFWSLAPHDVSICLYLFNADPDRVTANGACYLQPGIEDVVFANLHFSDGRMAQIHVSWLDPHKERKMVVVGSKKMLVFDDMQPAEKLRVYDKGASVQANGPGISPVVNVRYGDIFVPHVGHHEPLDLETQHFIDCIREDRNPRSDGRDGLRVVRILQEVDRQLSTLRRQFQA